VGGQRHAPAALPPGKRTGNHCIGGWVGPRVGLDGGRKISPPPRFDPRTVQPVASRYTDPPGYCVLLLMRCCVVEIDKTVSAPLRTSCTSKRKAGSSVSFQAHLFHSRIEPYCRQKANGVINAGNKIHNRGRFWVSIIYIPFSPPIFFIVFLPYLRFPKFQF